MSGHALPEWLRDLSGRLDQVRPEALSQFLPPAEGGRPSAVLILFGPHADGEDVLLTQRASDLRAHPNQVAFPGGSVDPDDASPAACAMREAQEETALSPDGVEVLGPFPDIYLPRSDFVVTPVLAWWAEPSPVAAVDPVEVARVVRVPLLELLDPANRFTVRHPSGLAGPGFAAQGLFVWGFTAGLLSRVLRLAGLEQPWDGSRLVDLPEGVG